MSRLMKSPVSPLKALVLLTLVLACLSHVTHAQDVAPATAGAGDSGSPAGTIPPALKGITIAQKLNNEIPLDLHFRDEAGRDVTLRQYFTDRPVILNLSYFRCPMLCPEVVRGLARSLKTLTFRAGTQYTVLTVSFDPADTPSTAAEKKKAALAELGQPDAAAGWHFLTGDESSIRKLTDAVGFAYRWDPASHQFFHAAGIMVITPEGRLSRYFYGIDFRSTDLRLGLVEASHEQIGTAVDAVLLFCCRYDALTGTYDWVVGRILSIAGALTVLTLVTFLYRLSRRDPDHPVTG